jgi:hypothetical protein
MRYFTHPLFTAGTTFAVLSALTLSGCPTGGTLEDPDRFVGGTSCDAKALLQERCAGSICHEGNDALGGVDLVADGVEARLVGVPASYENVETNPEDCPTNSPELLIDPNNVEASLLLTKLLGTHACGDPMPIPNPPGLTEAEIECLTQWARGLATQGGVGGTGGTSATGGAANGGMGGA